MEETFQDNLLAFSLPQRNARGRIVRLDNVVDEVLSAHDYPPAITNLLAEALTLTALLGGLLKGDGSQLTMQAQTQPGKSGDTNVVSLLVCDYKDGALRGYVEHDPALLEDLGANPNLATLFGEGYLAITFDLVEKGGRYQGIVPLEGASLSEACERYFAQSEQVPTLIRLGIRSEAGRCVAGGLLIQHLAEGEEGRERLHAKLDHPEWEHVAVLGGSIRHDELTDPELSLEALIWRLFHEETEIRSERGAKLSRGCRCTSSHYEEIIARFPESEQDEMRNEDGKIIVDCAFCAKEFSLQC